MNAVHPEVYLVASSGEASNTESFAPGMWDYLKAAGVPKKWAEDHVEQEPGEFVTEVAGRMCYRSFDASLNKNLKSVRKDSSAYFKNILESGHGSVLEHVQTTWIFRNVSRVFTHELVRHRAGCAYSQESLRFVRLTDIPFWMPTWAQEDPELMKRSAKLLEAMEEHQRWMAEHFGLDAGADFREKKAKTSFMRRFAPIGLGTTIMMSCNIRALRHIIRMRTSEAAEEEIRMVFGGVAGICKQEWPDLFQDMREKEDGSWVFENEKV